jgi:Ulp1 family protease
MRLHGFERTMNSWVELAKLRKALSIRPGSSCLTKAGKCSPFSLNSGNTATLQTKLTEASWAQDSYSYPEEEAGTCHHDVDMDANTGATVGVDDASAKVDQDGMDVETKGGKPVSEPESRLNSLTIQQKVQLRIAPLTPQQRAKAEDILQRDPTDELLTDQYGITMTRKKLSCLRARTWLNDEVINFFMSMLKDRDEALCRLNPTGRKSSHYFNSFFMSKLLDTENKKVYSYDAVNKWTKTLDIFTKRRIYIPINISNSHWTHLVLYMEQRKIHYYDSMGGNGRMYIEAILHWIKDEARTKKNWEEYDVSDFTLIDHGRDVPQQGNGFDCGIFSCTFALFDTDDLPFHFDQVHMPNFRLRICLDILEGGFSYPITL